MDGIPKKSLDQLTCSRCKNYLAYFPIMQAEDEAMFCGQCHTDILDKKLFHARAYEILAEHTQFPCRNKDKGCLEKLVPKKLDAHEMSCDFKLYPCPCSTSKNCTWSGVFKEIASHCEEIHPEFVLSNHKFEMDLSNLNNHENLLIIENDLIILKRTYVENLQQFRFAINYIRNIAISQDFEFILYNQNKSFKFSSKLRENVSDINIEILKHIAQTSNFISGEIRCFAYKIQKPLEFGLKCLECHNYNVTIPLQICTNGHNVCCYCKNALKVCPVCQSKISDYKSDITFQTEIKEFLIRCKNFTNGCCYYSKLEHMEEHYGWCQKGTQICPFKAEKECAWDGLTKNVIEHVQNYHSDELVNNDESDFLEIENGTSWFYAIIFSDKLFNIYILNEDDNLYWSVQFIGPEKESSLFYYELITEDQFENMIMTTKRNCSRFEENQEDFFKDGAEYACINLKSIKPLPNNRLYYIIRISKK